jgi:hypothetical protein
MRLNANKKRKRKQTKIISRGRNTVNVRISINQTLLIAYMNKQDWQNFYFFCLENDLEKLPIDKAIKMWRKTI